MGAANSKLEREKRIVVEMIALYCRANCDHANGAEPCVRVRGGAVECVIDTLCPSCAELARYACERSDRCPYQETKTFCVNCSTHCYRPEMRERIREVMRYAGPRMARHRPVAALRHLLAQKREARKLARGGGGKARA